MSEYSKKLRDPRWQKKRLQIFERDEWSCVRCGDTGAELQVHHKEYIESKNPWESPDNDLETLCKNCHEGEYIKIIISPLIKDGAVFRLQTIAAVNFPNVDKDTATLKKNLTAEIFEKLRKKVSRSNIIKYLKVVGVEEIA